VTALDVPRIEILRRVTQSPDNELGLNGVGEAGRWSAHCSRRRSRTRWNCPHSGIEVLEMPLRSARLWKLGGWLD
jgi:hypothetical protein